MSRFSDVIEKMKIKKKKTDNTRKKEKKTIFQFVNLMKKSAILREKKRKEKLMKERQRGGYYPPLAPSNNNHIEDTGNKKEIEPTKEKKSHVSINIESIMPVNITTKTEKDFVKKRFADDNKEKENIKLVNETYPLKSKTWGNIVSVNAFCNIKFSEEKNSLIYNVIEPPLTPDDETEIKKIKKYFEETISIHFEGLRTITAIEFVKKTLLDCIKKYGLHLSKEKEEIYKYYLFREFIGLGKVESIINDQEIEDISCDGINIPIFVFHRNPKFGSIETNVMFRTKSELEDFVMKLAQRSGKTVSIANPYFDGALTDGSRVQATLGTDIATHGSNFTIRKFLKDPITPTLLLKYKTVDANTLAYIWFLIEYNTSILVVGGTASGKTSLLNALSLFIRPEQKVVSIEDTPELQISHPHWIAEISREGFETIAGHEKKVGEVSMLDLLKEALRQRPDYILVGEVRGEEAIILFQAMATGHSGMATIHADSLGRLIDRITSKPLSIPVALLETLDMIIFIKRLRYKDTFVRRLSHIYEIEGYDKQRDTVVSRDIFEWDAISDQVLPKEESILLGNIYTQKGVELDVIRKELKKRAKVLDYMEKKNIINYKDVSKIINKYYMDSDALIEQINSVQ